MSGKEKKCFGGELFYIDLKHVLGALEAAFGFWRCLILHRAQTGTSGTGKTSAGWRCLILHRAQTRRRQAVRASGVWRYFNMDLKLLCALLGCALLGLEVFAFT